MIANFKHGIRVKNLKRSFHLHVKNLHLSKRFLLSWCLNLKNCKMLLTLMSLRNWRYQVSVVHLKHFLQLLPNKLIKIHLHCLLYLQVMILQNNCKNFVRLKLAGKITFNYQWVVDKIIMQLNLLGRQLPQENGCVWKTCILLPPGCQIYKKSLNFYKLNIKISESSLQVSNIWTSPTFY